MMKTRNHILILALLLSGCSRPTGPSAKIAFMENGSPMTNRYSLLTQVEVVRSHLILNKTVDALNLATKWDTDSNGAVERLRNSLDISTDTDQGTITIALRRIPETERAEIINSLSEQIPKDNQSISDPTPPMTPRNFDLTKIREEGMPHSTNARTIRIQAEIVNKAK
jgi:PBP1b-binding outer membrane lipoprotein LpoB